MRGCRHPVSKDGIVNERLLALRLREDAARQPVATALDAGLGRPRERLADCLDAQRASPRQMALACALACPDPPSFLWREVLASALQQANPTDRRHDLYLVARFLAGGGVDPCRAADLFSLPLKEAAVVLSSYQRVIMRERARDASSPP